MRHLAGKIFNDGKAPKHVYSYTKFQLFNLINSRDKGVPKSNSKDGVAVVRMRHLAENFSTC